MPDELEDIIEDAEGLEEGQDAEEQPEAKPQYVTKEDFDALRTTLESLTEVLNKKPDPPVKEPDKPDARTPWEIAEAEAEAQGLTYNETWISKRALQIQDQAHREELKRTKDEIINAFGGMMAPVQTDRAITKLAGGDTEIAAELEKMIEQGVVTVSALQDENVARVCIKAAKQEVAERKGPAFPGAAPTGGSGTAQLNGIRSKLTPSELSDLKEQEKKYGKFDEEDILEAYGPELLRR